MLSKKNKKPWGFTLVELLVILSVSAILFSISYVGISEIRKTIRDNKRRADIHLVARALEAFKADYGQYPPNNYSSGDTYNIVDGWTADANETMMPVLEEGHTIPLVYRGITGPKTVNQNVQGGYLSEYIKDPINNTNDWDDSYAYVYWGSSYAWATDLSDPMWEAIVFPIECPEPPGGTCGIYGGSNLDTWGRCCNYDSFPTEACFDEFCSYDDEEDTLSWIVYNTVGFGRYCYGESSTRNLAILATRLEKESKPAERIDEIFAFCPTADQGHPNNDLFKSLKSLFPRGKPCYDGSSYACVDQFPNVNGTDEWKAWGLNNYNYFIPLTGEFNLR